VTTLADPEVRDDVEVLLVAVPVAGEEQLIAAQATGDHGRGALDAGRDDEVHAGVPSDGARG
jgi:hypothetical protein